MRNSSFKIWGLVTLEARRPMDWAIWFVGLLFLVLRFVGLEQSPLGFFSDEFRGALHQVCIAQTGMSAHGDEWPSFVEGGGGGFYSPPFLYGGAAWQLFWGFSIESARSFTALCGALTVVGTVAIAHRIGGVAIARWVFLVAALSPWGFQFSRVAWDPPMAVAFLVWAVYFWLLRDNATRLALSAACFTGAIICYPPTRIQAPLLFLAMGAWGLHRRSVSAKQILGFVAVCSSLGYTLIRGTLTGELNRRGSFEAIWSPDFVARNRGPYSEARFLIQTFLDNFHAHFRPSYLFFTGDQNGRHSTQWMGEFGFMEDLALLVLIALIVRWICLELFPRARISIPAPGKVGLRAKRLAGFGVLGFLLGILPAALCWTGVPHALRAIGSWPFLAMVAGFLLHLGHKSWRYFQPGALGVAVAFVIVFGQIYFVAYPKVDEKWFDVRVQRAMTDPAADPALRDHLTSIYPEAFRYYSIISGKETCQSSMVRLEEWKAHGARSQSKRPSR